MYNRKADDEGLTPRVVEALRREGHVTDGQLVEWFKEGLKDV